MEPTLRVASYCCIISTLKALSSKFNKAYCFPSQASLVSLLARFYGVSICRSTLNNYLSILEAQGYIRRIKRIKRLPSGALRFASTVYILTHEAYKLLHRFGSSLFSAGVRVFSRARKIVYHPRATIEVHRYEPSSPDPPPLGDLIRKFIETL